MKPRDLSRLTRKIADEAAATAFGSNCYPIGGGWYAIPPRAERDGWLNDTIRYLRARAMLQRNHATGHYRVIDAPA